MLSSLAFLAGVVAVQQLAELPNISLLALLAASSCFLLYRHYRLLAYLLLGVFWASVYGYWRLSEQLPTQYQNTTAFITGYISSVPEQLDRSLQFDFVVEQAPSLHFPGKIRLNWYTPPQPLYAGQHWRCEVQLKKPHGLSNPNGIDYEAWLFANHIAATGNINPDTKAELISNHHQHIASHFNHWRQIIIERLNTALGNSAYSGLIKALTVGEQHSISQSQWQVFNATGTTHLIVISGSHIGLIAGLVYVLTRKFWARLGILTISPQQVAALMAWLTAMLYSGLAGYSLPTLRTMIMLTVTLTAISWQRHTSAMQILILALTAVLITDPLAVLAIGFWLSFLAVALLIYISAGRLGRARYWQAAIHAQLASFIGLAPILIAYFHQLSLIAPLANAVAIPLIGLIIVPLALLALPLLFLWPIAAKWLLSLTDQCLQGLYWLLSQLATLPYATLNFNQPPWYALILAGVGVLLLLAPKGFPARHLSVFLFLPMLFAKNPTPETGDVWLTLLDVGQGLSVVAQTHEHNLVYDTGAKLNQDSDSGMSVIAPYLRYQGIEKLDLLMISHGDNDHSGGAESVLKAFPVDKVSSSVAPWAVGDNRQYCLAGQQWQWDQVQFQILSPPTNQYFDKENNNSCVLKISTDNFSMLLTADIEQDTENWLSQHYGKLLHSTVLIAPHHGSKTSSSYDFLLAVNPEWALIPAGYLNRFHFPHEQVLARYRQLNLPWLNTANSGAISIKTSFNGFQITTERELRKRYWQTE